MFEWGWGGFERLASLPPGRFLWILSFLIFLLSCGELPSQPSAGCSHPINPDLESRQFSYDGRVRRFMLTGCADGSGSAGLPVILAFHGGGQSLHNAEGTGFLDYTALRNAPALVIAPEGQVSWNGHTWKNAFPWLKSNPDDDRRMTQALVAELDRLPDIPAIDPQRIFALGKSDGAGMALSLACEPSSEFQLAGVAAVSGAYFGVGSASEFGTLDASICRPKYALPLLMIHGTSDRVMPFKGQKFVNPKAIRHAQTYWFLKDPGILQGNSNTYTADVDAYARALALDPQKCSGVRMERLNRYSTRTIGQGCQARFETIWVEQGGHVWEGHPGSGPDSNQDPNLDFDATREILGFFGLLH